ncbi:dihydrodipicolinate synthase family protein [Terriglobus tenax]|uniref:dihydrodipicolinate synthase family protein n=1 Tax=Terriglobus tenax TaxID=1111115 RepID=UPI0021E0B617|nr:dihydrodipicolinate synthase family protein [Terriglobus tenax]
MDVSKANWKLKLSQGAVIPAHPLALTVERKLDERHQRALARYYRAAGADGVAVGVHSTQFEIREKQYGLYQPVLELAADTLKGSDLIMVAGVCGKTDQALAEAKIASDLGYNAALLSLAAMGDAPVDEILAHVRAIGAVMPIIGFYLQPAVGGRIFPYEFWCRFAEIESVIAIKIAPFHRYATQDVLRGVIASGRSEEITLYTGNDDHIVLDLLSPFQYGGKTVRMKGGLLGHWAVWTERAAALHREIKDVVAQGGAIDDQWLIRNGEVTDMNAAIFDVANHFHGCIAGIHEVLRRQGLMQGRWCLNPKEELSPGQMEEIDRVIAAYPHLVDDGFVKQNLDSWLS